MNINDYQAQLGINAKSIADIDQELQSLKAAEDSENQEMSDEINNRINSLEMRKAVLQQQQTNTQAIINAYNSMRENIRELRNLSEIVPADAQERDKIAEEEEQREAAVINSRAILPEELQEQISQEFLNFNNENTNTVAVANSTAVGAPNTQEVVPVNVTVEPYNETTELGTVGDHPRIEENDPNVFDVEYQEVNSEQQIGTTSPIPSTPIENSNNTNTSSNIRTPMPSAKDYKYDEDGYQEFVPGTSVPMPRERENETAAEYEAFLEDFYKSLEANNIFKDETKEQGMSSDRKRTDLFKYDDSGNIEFLPGTLIPRPRDRIASEVNDEDYVSFLKNYYDTLEKNNLFKQVSKKEPTKDEKQKPGTSLIPTNNLPGAEVIPVSSNNEVTPPRIEEKPAPLGITQKPEFDPNPPKKPQPKRGLITIIDELTRDLEIKAKTGKKYTASNIKVASQFKKEIKSGNVWYNVVHFVPTLVKTAALGIKKVIAKIKLSKTQKENMVILKERIDNLSEEDLMTIYNEYRGSRVTQERFPSALNVLLQEKINNFTYGKLTGLNQKIASGYQTIFQDAVKLNAIETELKQEGLTPERKAELQTTKATCLSGKAELVKNIRNSYIEANQWMSGGAHGFDEDMKAAATGLSYVGKRFVKERNLNNELTARQAQLEQIENKAIADGNDAQAMDAFLKTETLLSGETEIKKSIWGHRSAGDKYYTPVAEQLDYRDDPFIRDVLTTVAVVGAGVSAVNAVRTHGTEADKVLAGEQMNADHVNSANQQTIDQVQQTGQDIAGKRADFQEGMTAQTQGNINNFGNTYERYAFDHSAVQNNSDWNFGAAYHQMDNVGHEATRQMYETTKGQIENITSQYASGALSQADALASFSKLATESQQTVNNLLQEYMPTFTAYAQSHPQFDMEGISSAMSYLTTHPDAIAKMNQGMVDVTNMGDSLAGVSMESVQALQSLPSDVQTTLFGAATAAGLAYKVATTTQQNAKQGKYGNELTNMVEEYSAMQEQAQETMTSTSKKAA